MDKIDLQILACLKENARMKASDISKEINYSISSVLERIKKMEKSGVIEKYTLLLNEKKLGSRITAIMEVSLKSPACFDKFTEFVKADKGIMSCYYLTGEFDFMLKIIADSSEALEKIHRAIKGFDGVSAVKTSLSLKEIKNEISVLPEGDEVIE